MATVWLECIRQVPPVGNDSCRTFPGRWIMPDTSNRCWSILPVSSAAEAGEPAAIAATSDVDDAAGGAAAAAAVAVVDDDVTS